MKICKKYKKNGKNILELFGIKFSRSSQKDLLTRKISELNWKLDYMDHRMRLLGRFFIDESRFGRLPLMLQNLYVLDKYEFIFYQMPKDAICIDGGANAGLFTDVVLTAGGVSYAFEPNSIMFNILKDKFEGNDRVVLEKKAIFTSKGTVKFNVPKNANNNFLVYCESGTISNVELYEENGGEFLETEDVETVSLSDYVTNLVKTKGQKIYLVKIDIEGAEFEVLEDLIKKGVYKDIEYVLCETHERSFKDGAEKLSKLKNLIKEYKVTNIFLDWV